MRRVTRAVRASGAMNIRSPCARSEFAIITDADEPGRKHGVQVAASLFGRVESLKVLGLPGAKDLSEWTENGGTRNALLELIRNTQEWKAQTGPSAQTQLVALAVEELLTREIKPRANAVESDSARAGSCDALRISRHR